MFTNESNSGKSFGDEIVKKLSSAHHAEIASGYFGWKDLSQLTSELVKVAKRGSCKLLFGMIFHERATLNQKNCLLKLNKKLKEVNESSGVYVTLRPYHGKVYRIINDDKESIYVGSSNLSASGFKNNMEFNLKIKDTLEKESTISFLNFLFAGEGIKKNISCPLENVELKLKGDTDKVVKDEKTLRNFEIEEKNFPEDVYDKNYFKIKHRPNAQLRSSLNLYFEKGRKVIKDGRSVYTPRPWYEVEVTSQTKEREHPDYPKGEWVAYVNDDIRNKFYKLHMVTSSGDIDSPKAIQTSKKGGGRRVLGELIKGRMEEKGVLQKFTRITDEVLEEYGKDFIELKKISTGKYILRV